MNLSNLYSPSRRLQEHQSIERGDAAIAADVIARVEWAAACCDLQRNRGVRSCESIIHTLPAASTSALMIALPAIIRFCVVLYPVMIPRPLSPESLEFDDHISSVHPLIFKSWAGYRELLFFSVSSVLSVVFQNPCSGK